MSKNEGLTMSQLAEVNAQHVTTIAALEAKCAALAADNEKAMETMRQADDVVRRAHSKFAALADENMALRSALENGMAAPETPATDAYLEEVRAQGVEMVIAYHRERADALHHVDRNNAIRHSMAALDASDVAAQLRQEAAQ